MILKCSRGHQFDTKKAEALRAKRGILKPGDLCPVVIRYRILAGSTTYCRRVLGEVKEEEPGRGES